MNIIFISIIFCFARPFAIFNFISIKCKNLRSKKEMTETLRKYFTADCNIAKCKIYFIYKI